MADSFLSDSNLRQPPVEESLPPRDPFVEDPATSVFQNISYTEHSKIPIDAVKPIQKALYLEETGLFDSNLVHALAEVLGISVGVVEETKFDAISLKNQVRKYLGNR